MKRALSLLLIVTMLLPQASIAQTTYSGGSSSAGVPGPATADPAPAAKRHNAVLGALLGELSARYERIMAQMPTTVADDVEVERKAQLSEVISRKKAELESGAISIDQLRDEVSRVNQESMQQQKDELLYQINNMPAETLDRIAAVMHGNQNYTDSEQEYNAAYTRTEKARAISHAVLRDLDNHLSMLNKGSRFMSKDAWLRDLSRTEAAFNTKSSGKWLKILGYAALSVAAVGLLSWGVASAVYGGKYSKRKSELDQQFEKYRSELEAHYNDLNTRLSQDEVQYLTDNGYVWTTCGSYQMPSSILCNRYNYQLFSGTTYCTVSCYRNPTSGKETLHSAPTCSSPYIPADCYDPNEYTRGYNDGYDNGYNDGYNHGSDDGDYDGRNDGYNDGYDRGKSDGYNQGYDDGFSYGYNSYWAMSLKPVSTPLNGLSLVKTLTSDPSGYQSNYNQGFNDGKADARMIFGGAQ